MTYPRPSSVYVRLASSLLTLGLFVLPSIFAQAQSAVSGNVKTFEGLPLADVTVHGSKSCCPLKQDHMTTDKDGRFQFEHAQQLIHFQKDGFQPKTIVVEAGSSPINVVLQPATDGLVVPLCGKPGPGDKQQVGWGRHGIQFSVPVREVTLSGGKPDVDYVSYAVRRKGSAATLELWFGIYSANLEPDDEQFINSQRFAQRLILNVNGKVIGKDSSGSLRDGGSWRHTTVTGQSAAIYTKAGPDDVKFFDQIVNSICEIPSSSE